MSNRLSEAAIPLRRKSQPMGLSRISFDLKLLLCLARVHLEPAGIEEAASLLREKLNWDFVLNWSLSHRIAPLLASHLNGRLQEAIPQSTLDCLQKQAHGTTFRNLLLMGELLQIMELFEAHGIRAIPFKGPTLAMAAYGNVGLRMFGDLDLLLHTADFSKARELMLARGYRLGFALSPNEQNRDFASSRHLPLRHEERGVLVELHSHFTPSAMAFPIDLEQLWDRLAPLCLNGNVVQCLAPDDLLLILCVHGSKHGWSRLIWICDVAEILRSHPGLNWSSILQQARRARSERMLFLGLLLAHELLEAPLPEDLVRKIRHVPLVAGLADMVYRRIFGSLDYKSDRLESTLYHLRIRERLWDGLYFSVNQLLDPVILVPNQNDRQLLSLPRTLFFLYYMLRPFRLTAKYSQIVFRDIASKLRRKS